MTQRSRGRRVTRKSRTGLWLTLGGIGSAAILIILLVLLFGRNTAPDDINQATLNAIPPDAVNAERFGEKMPDEGDTHVANTEQVAYKTNPPTSGSHWGTPGDWKIYREDPLPDQMLVHNLEHGGVIISYRPDISADELAQLETLYREFAAKNKRVILTVRPGLQSKVALTAWTYLLKLDTIDQEQIRKFYNGNIARGPECQEGKCPE